jgi:hypothetical protein
MTLNFLERDREAVRQLRKSFRLATPADVRSASLFDGRYAVFPAPVKRGRSRSGAHVAEADIQPYRQEDAIKGRALEINELNCQAQDLFAVGFEAVLGR